jgi:multidrug efflux pump subunit AcrA (membrane-fusion protein)
MAEAAPKVVPISGHVPRPSPAADAPAAAPSRNGVEQLLRVEADARKAASLGELKFLIANEAAPLCRARQVFLLGVKGRRIRMSAVSGLGQFDGNAPMTGMLESAVGELAADGGLGASRAFLLTAYAPPGDPDAAAYPHRFAAWQPLLLPQTGQAFAGLLMTRDTPWSEPDLTIAKRLGDTFAHAWIALAGRRRIQRRWRPSALAAALAAATVLAGFIPVNMTVLAPVRIVSSRPAAVTAPQDGVIDAVLVNPNDAVEAGAPLLRLSDVRLKNELALAEQEVIVAQARLRLVEQGAVSDAKIRRELAVQRAELALKLLARDYAGDLLAQTLITAPVAGVAVFSDKRDLAGRPLTTGQQIMQIADPDALEFEIDLPVADALNFEPGAPVRAFLDSSPLDPVSGALTTRSFEARPTESNALAYRLTARIGGALPQGARLGIRGTAQITGGRTVLAYFLFRRPISAVRQWLGR